MNSLPSSSEPGPFCLILNSGLPRAPISPYDKTTINLRAEINNLLEWRYQTYTIGTLVTAFATGKQRFLPSDQQLLEPIPEHGVVFHDPAFLLHYPESGGSNLRHALRDLIIAVTDVDSEASL